MAVASARMSDIERFCLPRWTAFNRFGMAMAAKMPMIAMTINSSIRVKPDCRFFINGLLVRNALVFRDRSQALSHRAPDREALCMEEMRKNG
jgi:hypothetical protein